MTCASKFRSSRWTLKSKNNEWDRKSLCPYLVNDKTKVCLAKISHLKSKEMANTGFEPKSIFLQNSWIRWYLTTGHVPQGSVITLAMFQVTMKLILRVKGHVFQVPWDYKNLGDNPHYPSCEKMKIEPVASL